MKEEILFEFFDKNINLQFDEVIKILPKKALKLKYSKLKEIYSKWRNQYLLRDTKKDVMTLDEFCYMKAIKALKVTIPEDVKSAILMKKENYKAIEIEQFTGISKARLRNIFADAYIHGLLENSKKIKM